jgi:hypothetical protein
VILKDLEMLKKHGAKPSLNVLKYYERDVNVPFFPTDVYSFHIDKSTIPTDTYLCTYFGAPSEILPNSKAIKKILIPEIREKLKKLYKGKEADFETFLAENFFDLHYEAKSKSSHIKLGVGQLWRLAVEHPESQVLPCIHRAPEEKNGQTRLFLIC